MPAQAIDLPPLAHGRKATWFELFFDLVFVVAVAQMAVTVIGYGVSDAFGARGAAFALGLAGFKALLAVAYLRERHWRGAHGLIRAYAGLYLLQAALWTASAALPPAPCLGLWLLALALDLASPWWPARYTTTVRPHPEHLPERFGLFTVILLGEGVASVVHSLDHGQASNELAVAADGVGLALTFLTWLGYFEVTRAHGEREVGGVTGGRNRHLLARIALRFRPGPDPAAAPP